MAKGSSRWEKYATKNKLRLKPDDCGELIAVGKLGQVYEYSDDEVGAIYIPAVPRKGWKNFKDKMIGLGAVLTQNGDIEGAVRFMYENLKALRTACSLLKIRSKRSLSPERKAQVVANLAAWRKGEKA